MTSNQEHNSDHLPELIYNETTIQAARTLLQLYTTMAYELCSTLASAYRIDSSNIPAASTTNSTSFEALFDYIYEQDLESDPIVFYKNEDWFIDLHGEHCLFQSQTGISIEVSIYNYEWIDAGFFSSFIHSLAKSQSSDYSPLAQILITAIPPANFQSILSLLEHMSTLGIVNQQTPVNFTLTDSPVFY